MGSSGDTRECVYTAGAAAGPQSAGYAARAAPQGSSFDFQSHDESAQCLAAMRKLVLGLQRQLGSREARFRVEKMRIVAETRRSTRRVDDRSVPAAFGENRFRIVAVA